MKGDLKMKKLCAGLAAFAAIAFVLPTAASAAPIVILNSPLVAGAVDGLVVNGNTYNVTFVPFATDTTFVGNPAGAATAIAELDAALNGTTAPFVALQGDGSINQFIVQDVAAAFSGIETTSFSIAHNWQNIGSTTGDASVAVFTPVAAAPEPASLALLGSALLGFGVVLRCRNRA